MKNFCIPTLAFADSLWHLFLSRLHFLQEKSSLLMDRQTDRQTECLPPCELRDSPRKQKQQQVATLCVCSPPAESRQPVATHCSSISAHLYPNNNYCLTARPTLSACLLNNGIVKWRRADLFVTPPGACKSMIWPCCTSAQAALSLFTCYCWESFQWEGAHLASLSVFTFALQSGRLAVSR